MDQNLNRWLVSADKAEQLRRFHASDRYPKQAASSGRKHDVSRFWEAHIQRIQAFTANDSIAVSSTTSTRDPDQIAQQRQYRGTRISKAARLVGAAGSWMPHASWKRLMERTYLLSQLSQQARREIMAKKAFQKSLLENPDPVLRLDTLQKVPILEEQAEASPGAALYVASMINAIGPSLAKHQVHMVLEIGPADALLAVALHSLFRCRFILVDLPEVMSMGFAAICHYAPQASVALPHEVDSLKETAWERDFILLCPEQVSMISDQSVDCAINSSSFQEMTYPLIEEYFRLIDRCLKPEGLFYCHNEVRFTRHRDGSVIEFDRYPWRSGYKDLFNEISPFWRHMRVPPVQHRLQVKPCAAS